MKRPSSPSYQLDFLRRGILWHISHGWGDRVPLLPNCVSEILWRPLPNKLTLAFQSASSLLSHWTTKAQLRGRTQVTYGRGAQAAAGFCWRCGLHRTTCERSCGMVSRNRAKPGGVLPGTQKVGRWLADPTWRTLSRRRRRKTGAMRYESWSAMSSALTSLQRDSNLTCLIRARTCESFVDFFGR